MSQALIDHLSRLRDFLGREPLKPSKAGTYNLETTNHNGYIEFRNDGRYIWHSWSVSYHNGDHYDHRSEPMNPDKAIRELLRVKHMLEAEVREKIKTQLENEAVEREMVKNKIWADDSQFRQTL